MNLLKTLALALLLALSPGCLPLALNAAQSDRVEALQKQNDERYAEIQRRLAVLEAQRGIK